jgi:hypothetical protein
MAEYTDMSQEDYLRQRPRSAAEEFGENVTDPGYAYDDGPPIEPPPTSSAARFGAQRKRLEAEAAQQRQQAIADRVKVVAAEDHALAEVGRLTNAGQPVPDDVAAKAARAANRQGLLPRQSSADRLAGPTLSRLRGRPQDQDEDRNTDRAERRRGARPRG